MDDRKIFAVNLNSQMKNKKISRKQLCDEIGIKYSTLSEWLRGSRYPRIEAIRMIANFFDIPIHDLISYDENIQYKNKYIKILKRLEEELNKKSNTISLNGVDYIKSISIEKILEGK